MAGTTEKKKKKKSDRRKKAQVARAEAKIKAEQETAARQKAAEEERLRKWEESWEKKLKEQEELDDLKCCMSKGLCLRPKTQSNVWIKVMQDKVRNVQEVHMAIKRVAVPKPKPPPLPKLKNTEIMSTETKVDKRVVVPKKAKKVIKGTSKKKKP